MQETLRRGVDAAGRGGRSRRLARLRSDRGELTRAAESDTLLAALDAEVGDEDAGESAVPGGARARSLSGRFGSLFRGGSARDKNGDEEEGDGGGRGNSGA